MFFVLFSRTENEISQPAVETRKEVSEPMTENDAGHLITLGRIFSFVKINYFLDAEGPPPHPENSFSMIFLKSPTHRSDVEKRKDIILGDFLQKSLRKVSFTAVPIRYPYWWGTDLTPQRIIDF
jgi:hypothetical protein